VGNEIDINVLQKYFITAENSECLLADYLTKVPHQLA
jgi:hypothetical protein